MFYQTDLQERTYLKIRHNKELIGLAEQSQRLSAESQSVEYYTRNGNVSQSSHDGGPVKH